MSGWGGSINFIPVRRRFRPVGWLKAIYFRWRYRRVLKKLDHAVKKMQVDACVYGNGIIHIPVQREFFVNVGVRHIPFAEICDPGKFDDTP